MKTFKRTHFQKSRPESREDRLERQLRTIRQAVFDLPEHRQAVAGRIIVKLKGNLTPVWDRRPSAPDRLLQSYA